jgi:hypothetical protein
MTDFGDENAMRRAMIDPTRDDEFKKAWTELIDTDVSELYAPLRPYFEKFENVMNEKKIP